MKISLLCAVLLFSMCLKSQITGIEKYDKDHTNNELIKRSAKSKPYVILKLDDLKFENGFVHPGWIQVVSYLNKKGVTGTIGLIGESLEKGNSAYLDWINDRNNEGYEIWNHGFCHCRYNQDGIEIREYKGESFENQLESIVKTQKLAKEKLGITLRSFGAPFNSTDEFTVRAMDEVPNLKIWMYKGNSMPTKKFELKRISEVNIEHPVNQPNLEKFKKGYEKFKKEEVLIIQGHPRSWVEDEKRFQAFMDIIEFLKNEGVIFITPYDYYQSRP